MIAVNGIKILARPGIIGAREVPNRITPIVDGIFDIGIVLDVTSG